MSALSHEDLVSLVRCATENVFETMLGQSIASEDAYLDSVASTVFQWRRLVYRSGRRMAGDGQHRVQRCVRLPACITITDGRVHGRR